MSVVPLSYNTVAFAVKAINRCLMQKGFVLQVMVDSDNDIQDVGLVSVQDAVEKGFNPIALMPRPEPEPPRHANG